MTRGARRGDGPWPPEHQISALSIPEIHADPPAHCSSSAPSMQGVEGAHADPADAGLSIPHTAQTECWRIHFADECSSDGWIEGRLQHNPSSRWTGIINLDNDVLADDYLAADVRITVIFRATAWIRTWSLLTPTESREPLVTGCNQWKMVARVIFKQFG
ncbi:uncharacterized protein [Triticum aestivum]|uniref:uncharacterized protein n=1 Tax=Triticum aestivum TaxID=4565 RepID=UPI001D0121C1|nr:uncharacterized protein LOC123151643 [Triticum aestivum]